MMNLSFLIALPLLTAAAVLFCNGLKQVRITALAGSTLQLVLALWLLMAYHGERAGGNMASMLLSPTIPGFPR
jgi:NADH:ubiquinone oxidoreductase subunit 4 (subunit M)